MRYRFGDCVVDADLFELQRGGEPVSLQPKVLGLLLYLLENRHRTVLKEELLEALWADANVGEGSLTRAISLARSALAESGCPSEIIHTVRGRGYRIAVPVEVESLPPASNPSASPREPGSKKEAHEPSGESAPNAVAEAALGREAFERHAWQEAFQHFRAAEASGSLSPEELSTEAHAAWWCGDLEACVEARERAYAVFARSGHYRRAALMAMELARDSYFQLESVVSAAWLKRAERLLEGEGPCIERGYLERMRGTTALRFHADAERALDHAKHAFECATRFGDRDLQVVALHDQGWALVSKGQLADGMLLLDEAAAAAVAHRRQGQEDAAVLELEAARSTFERLGARPDLDRAAELLKAR